VTLAEWLRRVDEIDEAFNSPRTVSDHDIDDWATIGDGCWQRRVHK
jgi:hypothetical protein